MRSRRLFLIFPGLLAIVAALPLTIPASAQATPSVTTLVLAPANVTPGTPVVLTATVSAGNAPVHPGQVTFCNVDAPHCEDAAILGSVQLTAGGTATLRLRLGIGNYNVKAVFAGAPHGTPEIVGSTSAPQKITVRASGKLPSVSVLNTAGSGGLYNLTGSVLVSNTPAISGSINFTDRTNGIAELGSVSLAGVALSPLFASALSAPVGDLPIASAIADFNGDGILDLAVINDDGMSVTILIGNGDGSFVVRNTIATGGYAVAIATADFNSDGNPDLIVYSDYPFSEMVLLGTGDGGFTSKTTANPSYHANGYIIGDYNSDGIPDFAAYSYGVVTIYLGDGTGSFIDGAELNIPFSLSDIIAGDFNGDGIPDLAVAINSDYADEDAVEVYLGKGDGTFTEAPVPLFNDFAYAIKTADFNGDGNADLAVTTTSGVTILLGDGHGGFQPKAGPSATSPVYNFETADFNGDGIPDLILGLSVEDEDEFAQVFLGNGDGTFSSSTPINLGLEAAYFGIADFNGDGLPDVAVPNQDSNTLDVFLDQHGKSVTLYDVTLPVADLSNVVATYSGSNAYASSASAGVTALGNTVATPVILPGGGAFAQPTTITITDATPGAVIYYAFTSASYIRPANFALYTGPFQLPVIAAGGVPVFVTATASKPGYLNSKQTVESYQYAAPTVTTLHLNSGASVPAGSHFTLAAHVTANGVPFHQGVINFCDATVASCQGPALLASAPLTTGGWAVVKLILGVGVHTIRAEFQGISSPVVQSASFQPPITAPSVSDPMTVTVTGKSASATQSVTGANTTGTYKLSSSVQVFGSGAIQGSLQFQDSYNGGTAVPIGSATLSAANTSYGFVAAASAATGSTPSTVVTADLNNDGIADLVTANTANNSLSILYGVPGGGFTQGTLIPLPGPPSGVVVVDLNEDGIPDLVATSTSASAFYVLLGSKSGGFSLLYTQTTATAPQFMVTGDFNGDGLTDIAMADVAAGMVSVWLSQGDGYFNYHYDTALPANPVSLAVADFNGDSVPDLVTSNSDGSISVLLGSGPSAVSFDVWSFASAPLIFPGGSGPVVVADFNRDGIPDLAVSTGNEVVVYLGAGNGTFTLKTTLHTSDIQALNVIDLNGDGFPDLAVTTAIGSAERAVVYLNAGDATFPKTSAPALLSGGASTLVADFNGDGLGDLAATDASTNAVDLLLGYQLTPGSIDGVALQKGTHLIHAAYAGSPAISASAGPATTFIVTGP